MYLWQQIILRMEALDRDLDAGKITLKEYACRSNGLNIRLKCGVGALKSLEMSNGNDTLEKKLKKQGLIGAGSLITHTETENRLEVIDCEHGKGQITREECKGNSGSNKCDWSLCEQNDETRALITNRLELRGPGTEAH